MDLPLLAVTALGLVGVFLMLPRKKVLLARIGGLLGTLALGGFFLLLVRAVEEERQRGGAGGAGMPVYFYVFAAIMIGGAIGVVCHPRPVVAALYFVLVTLAGAGLFVLLMAEFMAIVLIIVYAGAILVTYVFVIMLASQGKATAEYDRVASEPLAAVLVSFILLGTILQVIEAPPSTPSTPSEKGRMAITRGAPDAMMVASLVGEATPPAATTGTTQPYVPGNIQVIGVSLYGNYAYSLELAGVLLTVALVGAVVIARKNTEVGTAGTGELPVE